MAQATGNAVLLVLGVLLLPVFVVVGRAAWHVGDGVGLILKARILRRPAAAAQIPNAATVDPDHAA
jgi:hypothetical protein